jgi:hypothetical protein
MDVFWLLSQPLPHFHSNIRDFRTSLTEFLNPVLNCFMWQTLPTINSKHLFINILCTELFCPQKMPKRTLPFGITLLKHGCHFDYWNQPLNMCMHVCYQMIHIENLLCALQLFYFNLWHIYWLSLVLFRMVPRKESRGGLGLKDVVKGKLHNQLWIYQVFNFQVMVFASAVCKRFAPCERKEWGDTCQTILIQWQFFFF